MSTPIRSLALSFTTTTLIRPLATLTPRNCLDGTSLISRAAGLRCKRMIRPGGEKYRVPDERLRKEECPWGKTVLHSERSPWTKRRKEGREREPELADYLVLCGPIGCPRHSTVPSSVLCGKYISITVRCRLKRLLLFSLFCHLLLPLSIYIFGYRQTCSLKARRGYLRS